MKDYNELYDWLQHDIMKPAVIRNSDTVNTFIRVPYDDDFDFIFHQDNYNGQSVTSTRLSYCGIYNKLNGQIYDAQQALRGKLSMIDSTKSMIDLYQDFDKDVCSRIEEIVGDDVSNLRNPFFENDRYNHLIDDFERNYADSTVRNMFLNGEPPETIHYECSFTIDRKDNSLMLRYLKYPVASVEKAATDYWRNHQDDILLDLRKNEILRQKLCEIEADADHPLHKQRAIINALQESGAKAVNVTVQKDGRSFTFKYPADRLSRYSNSDYGTWEMSPKDRQGYEECFGRYSSFHPEDIAEITYRGKTIYETDSFDQNEDDVLTDDESEDSDEGFVMSM